MGILAPHVISTDIAGPGVASLLVNDGGSPDSILGFPEAITVE